MKRFFASSVLILSLVIGVGAYVPVVQAGPLPEGNACPQSSNWIAERDQCEYGDGSVAALVTEDEAAAQEAAATAARIAKDKTSLDTTVETKQTPKLDGVTAQIMSFIMSLFAWLLGVAMIALNYAVYYTVVTMGDYVHNLAAVGIAWQILRDIGNILLIFGFLAVGITTILNVGWYGGGKKMLPMMLVAAVFLNFSLFISEAIIDTGNLFATQFYTQINGGKLPTPEDMSKMTVASEGVSNKIMSQLGLAVIYGQATTNSEVLKTGNSVFIGFMSIIVFLIAAFVMFSLAFILIFRFIALLFLIILAPVGFAGLAVPQLARRAGQWWSKLFEQTLTAPVLLLMLYIALAIITDINFLAFGPAGDWSGFVPKADGSTNLAGFASIILSFLVAMGLLLAVVIQSKNLSAFGAGLATKAAGALSFGAVSLGGRATLGMAGGLLASKQMQAWARSGKYGSQYALRAGVLAGKGLRGATYDVRNLPGVGAGLGALGVSAGKGATFTARQAIEAQFGAKPVKEFFRESAEEREKAGREIDFRDAQDKIGEINARYGTGPLTPVQIAARAAELEPHEKVIAANLSKMSTKQLEELGGIKKGVESLVANLSPQQFESLMKSDKLNETEKGNIKTARYRALSAALSAGDAPETKKVINAFSKGELESMPAEMLAHRLVLDQLSDKQRDTITDSKERTATEKNLVRGSSATGKVEAAFRAAGGGVAGAAAVAPLVSGLTVTQAAKLDKEVLIQPLVAERLTAAMLVELQEQKKLKGTEMVAIGAAIRASTVASAAAKNYITSGPGAALWS